MRLAIYSHHTMLYSCSSYTVKWDWPYIPTTRCSIRAAVIQSVPEMRLAIYSHHTMLYSCSSYTVSAWNETGHIFPPHDALFVQQFYSQCLKWDWPYIPTPQCSIRAAVIQSVAEMRLAIYSHHTMLYSCSSYTISAWSETGHIFPPHLASLSPSHLALVQHTCTL